MITAWLLLAVLTVGLSEPTPEPSVEPSSTTDLLEEGQDQVAILKQINRVNEDGSYTFGYEAADGSFKIETRDVAGNVKGMFGFVDEGGELKRVSYSASNGTGFQSTGAPNVPPLVTPNDLESTTRINLLPSSSTTTERPDLPVYIYGTTTRAPKPEVIQHIPKLRPTPASFSTEPTEQEEVAITRRPIYGSFLPKKSSTPNYISLRTSTLPPEGTTPRTPAIQIIRPRGYKKVLVTKRPLETTAVPLSSISSTTAYPTTNIQHLVDEEAVEVNQPELESNSIGESGLAASGTEDNPDVFGGPTDRPYPASVYRSLFSQVPQYQRILQTPFSPNNGVYPNQPQDPRYAFSPNFNGARQLPIAQGDLNRPQGDPLLYRQGQLPYPQGGIAERGQSLYPQQAGGIPYPAGLPQTGAAPYSRPGLPGNPYSQGFQQPGAIPYPQSIGQNIPYRQGFQQPGSIPYPQFAGQGNSFPVNPNTPVAARRPEQTLPPSDYNPTQGLVPTEPRPSESPKAEEDAARRVPPPLPPPPLPPRSPYPNVPQYSADQSNRQAYLMEQLIRMLLASRQQISPYQQNYDPRYQYQNYPYQQRPPFYPQSDYFQPNYDPRYSPYPYHQSPYPGYYDPYSQTNGNYPINPYQIRPPYNPYYQFNPYQNYNNNPYPSVAEEALIRMFLGARGNAPLPQGPTPQIQSSPTAYEGPQGQPTQSPVDVDPGGGSIFGRRIPITSNLSERSQREGSTARRSKGSRNVQIVEETTAPETSTTTTTTAKP